MRNLDALVSTVLTAAIIFAGASVRSATGSPARRSTSRSSAHTAAKTPAAPPDAFLRHPAATPAELFRQIAQDKRVRMTYAEYLAVSDAEAAARLHGLTPAESSSEVMYRVPDASDADIAGRLRGLKPATLPSSGEFTEYRRHGNGVIYPVHVRLPRGARLFANADRSLTLLAGSGDPIVPFAPVVNTVKAPAPPPPPPASTEIIVPANPTEVIQQGTGTATPVPQGAGTGTATAPASPPAAP